MRRFLSLAFALALLVSGCANTGFGTSSSTSSGGAAVNKTDSPVLARIVKSGKLRVGMSGNQPPLNFRGKSGKLMGLEVDLARAMARLMDAELEIVEMPFGQLVDALQSGKVDLVLSGMTITAERNMRVAFLGPYYLSGKSILTKSSALARARETGDLDQSNLKLAALQGSTSQHFVETLLPKTQLVPTKDYDEAVDLLLGGQVQALVADREIVALTAMLHPMAGLATLKQPLTIEPIGMAVPPGDPLLVNFLENTLGALEASQVLEALRVRWLERGDWIEELR